MIQTEVKSFDAISTSELYEILRLRSEVFVVEQDCVYADMDGKDPIALHIIGKKAGKIVAYSRIFKSDDCAEEASIGRVVVKKVQRKFGYGKDIMKYSIYAIEKYYDEKIIRISAQLYLERFYHELGFDQVGDGYLEDGIPHISMLR